MRVFSVSLAPVATETAVDRYDIQKRSIIMAGIPSKHTLTELLLRKALHHIGIRYRLHNRQLPGSPDLVLKRFDAVIFVHGCYWHSHGCYKSTVPQTHQEFWTKKFSINRTRDQKNVTQLLEHGWRVMTVWECALRGKTSYPPVTIANWVKSWLESSQVTGNIAGRVG